MCKFLCYSDLFHRVIVHSGVGNHPISFTTTEQAQWRFWKFAEHVSCLKSSVAESVACLKTIPQDMLKYLEETYTVNAVANLWIDIKNLK